MVSSDSFPRCCRGKLSVFVLAAVCGLGSAQQALALDQVCAGPQPAGTLEEVLSTTAISGYYWRVDPGYALLVEAGSTGSEYTLGHTLGRELAIGQKDRLEVLFPLDRVKGDPRNAKYTLQWRGKASAELQATGGQKVKVLAKLSQDTSDFLEKLSWQRTQIMLSPLNPKALFIPDSSFLEVGSVTVGGDAVYETAAFLGDGFAKPHGGDWLLWLRVSVANPEGAAGEVDLHDFSLLCHYVDYPATPRGPATATIGETSLFFTQSSDNHGYDVEYRWISLRFWNSLWEPGVIEQDWRSGNFLSKTWASPGLYHLIVLARSAADPEIENRSQDGLRVLVGPPAPERLDYPVESVTGEFIVNWSESAGATRYDIDRSSDGGAGWSRVYSDTAISFQERVGAGQYRYRVRACAPIDGNEENCGDWLEGTDDVIVQPDPPPSLPPVARIVSIVPESVELGGVVCFKGEGEDADGLVVAYEWTSNRQGVLSRLEAFCRADLYGGIHTIGLRVEDDAGHWSAAARRTLVVGNTLAEWPLDHCEARDVKSGVDGAFSGEVTCTSDRFGRPSGSLRFTGDGNVYGEGLPVVEGTFSLRLWVQLEANEGAGEVGSFFEIGPEAAGSEPAAPLRLLWDSRNSALSATHGPSVDLPVDGVAPGWHHLALSRKGESLSVYLDGVLEGVVADPSPLGTTFAMGGTPASGSPFHGALDHVVYDRRALEDTEVLAALLEGDPVVQIHGGDVPQDLSVYPGALITVLELRLQTGSAGGELQLTRLQVKGEMYADEGQEPIALSLAETVESVALLLVPCGAEGPGTEVGQFAVREAAVDVAVFELMESIPVPSDAEVCLRLQAKLAVDVPLDPDAASDPVLQFTLATADALSLEVQTDTLPPVEVFVAGKRRLEPAVEGNRYRIVPLPAVRLSTDSDSDTTTTFEPGPATLHSLRLEADSTEDLVIESFVYRQVEGTTLEAVANPRLYVDQNQNGELESEELLGTGVVEVAEGSIRFGGDGSLENNLIDPFMSVDLVLIADLTCESGETGSLTHPPANIRLPGGRGHPRWLPLLVAALAVLVGVLGSFVRPERAVALRPVVTLGLVSVATALLLPAGGCGGGGGGGGSPGIPAAVPDGSVDGAGPDVTLPDRPDGTTAEPREVQLGLFHAADLELRGAETGVAATAEGLPEDGLLGPRYRLSD